MIVAAPIWHTPANWTRCRNNHRPRDTGTSTRGNCVRFYACQRAGCNECALGLQNTALDVTVWYSVSKAVYDVLVKTDDCTPVLTLLHVAGYHNLAPDATEAAA